MNYINELKTNTKAFMCMGPTKINIAIKIGRQQFRHLDDTGCFVNPEPCVDMFSKGRTYQLDSNYECTHGEMDPSTLRCMWCEEPIPAVPAKRDKKNCLNCKSSDTMVDKFPCYKCNGEATDFRHWEPKPGLRVCSDCVHSANDRFNYPCRDCLGPNHVMTKFFEKKREVKSPKDSEYKEYEITEYSDPKDGIVWYSVLLNGQRFDIHAVRSVKGFAGIRWQSPDRKKNTDFQMSMPHPGSTFGPFIPIKLRMWVKK